MDAVVVVLTGSCVVFGETGGKSGGGNMNLIFYLSFPVISFIIIQLITQLSGILFFFFF